jgi:hypothetical protein
MRSWDCFLDSAVRRTQAPLRIWVIRRPEFLAPGYPRHVHSRSPGLLIRSWLIVLASKHSRGHWVTRLVWVALTSGFLFLPMAVRSVLETAA